MLAWSEVPVRTACCQVWQSWPTPRGAGRHAVLAVGDQADGLVDQAGRGDRPIGGPEDQDGVGHQFRVFGELDPLARGGFQHVATDERAGVAPEENGMGRHDVGAERGNPRAVAAGHGGRRDRVDRNPRRSRDDGGDD